MSQEGQNLVSALGKLLPDVQPSHMIGAGLALATLIGGAYALTATTTATPEKKFKWYGPKMIVPVLKPLVHRQTYDAKDSALLSPPAPVKSNEVLATSDENNNNEVLKTKFIGPTITPGVESVLILHNWPRGRKTPCISPFPLKLETFLRVFGVKYEVDFHVKGPTQCPWITIGVEDVIDSQNCIRFICEKFDIDPDERIDPALESQGRAYLHMLEHHLYWGISLHRWVFGEGKELKEIQFLPSETEATVPELMKFVSRSAWFHGIGKLTSEEVTNEVMIDLEALSDLLGDKLYMMSEVYPCELDCTAFAMLAQILWNMEGSEYQVALQEPFSNLEAFCFRMRDLFWPDWDDCLNDIPYDLTPAAEEDDEELDFESSYSHYA